MFFSISFKFFGIKARLFMFFFPPSKTSKREFQSWTPGYLQAVFAQSPALRRRAGGGSPLITTAGGRSDFKSVGVPAASASERRGRRAGRSVTRARKKAAPLANRQNRIAVFTIMTTKAEETDACQKSGSFNRKTKIPPDVSTLTSGCERKSGLD